MPRLRSANVITCSVLLVFLCGRILQTAQAQGAGGKPAARRGPRYLMAHYMPWYQADPGSGTWGWHWTMNHFHPERKLLGRREAASHYYPLAGLYDSGDPDLLEYHVLLMKMSGIDGVIVDWYGTDDFADYALLNRNTERIFSLVQKAGMLFAVCYEDQTIPKLIAGGRLKAAEAVRHGQQVLQWLQAHWFTRPCYLKVEGRPVLLVFGGVYYTNDQWRQMLPSVSPEPALFTELTRRGPAVGAFAWPMPEGGTAQSFSVLEDFYRRANAWPLKIAGAWPRFDDVYGEAGVQKSYDRIEDSGGATYRRTLQTAMDSGADIVQLVTWNDWGEGTQIEPSIQYGYRDLEFTQAMCRKYLKPRLAYSAGDLPLALKLYRLRKKYRGNRAVGATLDRAFHLLVAGRPAGARALLDGIKAGSHP